MTSETKKNDPQLAEILAELSPPRADFSPPRTGRHQGRFREDDRGRLLGSRRVGPPLFEVTRARRTGEALRRTACRRMRHDGLPLPKTCFRCLPFDLHFRPTERAAYPSLDDLAAHRRRLEDCPPSGNHRSGRRRIDPPGTPRGTILQEQEGHVFPSITGPTEMYCSETGK